MAKGILNISNYSGGLNNKTNPRDIDDNQFQVLDSLSIETPGKLKIMGAAVDYVASLSYTGYKMSNVNNSLTASSSDTAFTITAYPIPPEFAVNNVIRINNEDMLITAAVVVASAVSITVTRGYNSTTIAAHDEDDIYFYNSIGADFATSLTYGNGLFQFNADYDIDDTNGTVTDTEMLFLNTDVTSKGVVVFNLNPGSLAFGTLAIPYGNTFSPVVYSAVDGVVRVTPTSFNDGNTPKKLEYIKEDYNLGYNYSFSESVLQTSASNNKISVSSWNVLNAKPENATGVNVYLQGPNTITPLSGLMNTLDTGITLEAGNTGPSTTAVNIISSATNLYIKCSTTDAVKVKANDILLLGLEFLKVVSTNNTQGWINVTRGYYGSTALTSHTTGSDLKFVMANETGEIMKLPFSTFSVVGGGTFPAIETNSDFTGGFNVNFFTGEKLANGTIVNDTGEFFASDDHKINIFYEAVYTDNQRSNLEYAGSFGVTIGSQNNLPLFAQMWGKIPDAKNVKSYKFYYNENKSGVDDGIAKIDEAKRNVKYLLFEVDFRKGVRFPKGDEYKPFALRTHSGFTTQAVYTYPLDDNDGILYETTAAISLKKIKFKVKPETQIAETYIEQDDHVIGTAGTGYKTSTVANRRLYIGNVRYQDSVSGEKILANDTILKSNVNAFDTFSFENRIDVEVNDGDSITALESLGSKLLEFKRNHLYIINISRDVEFLEGTLEYRGCEKDYHVVRGEGFIAWFNKFGFYLYDGKQIRDLLLDKNGQQRLVWDSYYNDNNVIGYDPTEKSIYILTGSATAGNKQTLLSYDLKSRGISFRSKATIAKDITNIVNDNDGKMIWMEEYNASNVELRKLNILPSKLNQASNGTNGLNIDEIALKTKEFTFGKPSVDKKIISVYLSYKNGDGAYLYGFTDDGSEEILATLDGSSEANFKTLHIPIRKAKTEFVDKKAFDKIKGFGLRLSGSDVATDFEINDIQIVFREKSVK